MKQVEYVFEYGNYTVRQVQNNVFKMLEVERDNQDGTVTLINPASDEAKEAIIQFVNYKNNLAE